MGAGGSEGFDRLNGFNASTPPPAAPRSSRYPRLYGGACVRLASPKSAAAVYSEWLKTKCVASLPFLVTSTGRDPSEREATPLDRDRSGLFPPPPPPLLTL